MLHYYALRFAARLIGSSVRGRKLIISAILYREAGTRRGVAFEPLCVPSERMRPEQATLVRRSGIMKSERAKLFLPSSHLNLK